MLSPLRIASRSLTSGLIPQAALPVQQAVDQHDLLLVAKGDLAEVGERAAVQDDEDWNLGGHLATIEPDLPDLGPVDDG